MPTLPTGCMTGGQMDLSSPGGYRYPRPLTWNVSAEDLEHALEWTFDVREVSISYKEDENHTRSYMVTFQVGEPGILTHA